MTYHMDRSISVEQFIDVLNRSTLGLRRPVADVECMQAMLDHANLLVTAWDDDVLIGVARSVTDFSYCCYVSDLAVDSRWQSQGVGRGLLGLTQEQLGPHAKLILLSAPGADSYYDRLGFVRHPRSWILPSDRQL